MNHLVCESCGLNHNGLYGSGRFCGELCARGYSTKNNRKEVSDKMKKSLTITNNIQRKKRVEDYYKNPNYCKFCGEVIQINGNEKISITRAKKYCDKTCYYEASRKLNKTKTKDRGSRKHNRIKCATANCVNTISQYIEVNSKYCYECRKEQRRQEKLNYWLKTGDTGVKTSSSFPNLFRKYIQEDQNNLCAICQLPNSWNGKPLIFILDHIDGNAANNKRENVRLICHNCDSQLDTYKSKNKNSARTHRKQYTDK